MKCNNCQTLIPDDSSYCPSCGSKVVAEMQYRHSSPVGENEVFRSQRVANTSYENGSKSVVPKSNSGLIIILVLLTLVSLGLGAFLYQKYDEIRALEAKYQTLDNKYEALQDEYDVAEEKAKKYDKLIKPLTKNSSLGFSASEYIFVLSPKQESTFDLTTIFTNSDKDEKKTILTNQNGYSAKVEFTEDEWSFGTKIKITAVQPGTTTVHFTNTVDSKSFDIIVFVTN